MPRLKYILNYNNYFIYLVLTSNTINWIDSFNKPSYKYLYEIQNTFLDANYIFTWNSKLKKDDKNLENINILNFCEYNILKYKIIIFYIWDIEKTLEIKETLLKIKKEENESNLDTSLFFYEYRIQEFTEIYNKKINEVKLNKFWNLIENRNFYEKIHTYLYYNDFQNTNQYKKLLKLINDYELYDKYIEEMDNTNDNQRYKELEQQLKNWRKEWEIEQENNMEKKYYNIFKKIDIITNKYLT